MPSTQKSTKPLKITRQSNGRKIHQRLFKSEIWPLPWLSVRQKGVGGRHCSGFVLCSLRTLQWNAVREVMESWGTFVPTHMVVHVFPGKLTWCFKVGSTLTYSEPWLFSMRLCETLLSPSTLLHPDTGWKDNRNDKLLYGNWYHKTITNDVVHNEGK